MKGRRQHNPGFALLTTILIGGLLLVPKNGQSQGFECKPTVYPVQNFRAAIDRVQNDTKELADMFNGRERSYLDVLPNHVAQLNSIKSVPQLYSNKPVTVFLREVRDNSTIFNWENNALDGGRGTATVIGDVVSDLRKHRNLVLSRSEAIVSRTRQVIADSKNASHFFDSARGLFVKIRNGIQGIQDDYFKRAFDQLSACLASCAGPKGFDLAAFKGRAERLYTDPSSNNLQAGLNELEAGQKAVDRLARDLSELISDTKVDGKDTTKLDAQEASKLQRAADILSDAQRGSWTTIGANNDKIRDAINILNLGYQVYDKPSAITLTESAVARAQQAQKFIDGLLTEHTKLVNELRAFLQEYSGMYEPGCRPAGP